ncbi:MAG: AAA family ATPase [Thermoanaerobaculia bacterium]|nr:AAA family ATPase [Thermoanaerobaculia bacterium]
MLKLPYGIADFASLRRDGYVYVDRTAHIRTMEELGRALLFVRPRRFGKSLWLHTLSTYYDVRLREEHPRLFGDLEAGRDPTPLAHRYFTLEWNFSNIDPLGGGSGDPVMGIGELLEDYVNATIEAFVSDYRGVLEEPVRVEKNVVRSFENLLAAIRQTPYKLYLLIDEYDNFANEILIGDEPTYRRLVSADGPFKRLMKQVKAATEGRGVERLFLTGVTPLVLSDLTSGLNIAKNVSLEEDLNALCGFTGTEVRELIGRILAERRGRGEASVAAEEALEMMRTWYNGYRFARPATEGATFDTLAAVYNPTLTLYFLDHLRRKGTYPRQMLDTNLAADENKLRFLGREAGGGDVLAEMVQTGEHLEVERIEERFTLSEMLTQASQNKTALGSFLFYFGMLTIEGETDWRWLRLAPPNLVVRKLYVEQTLRQLLEGDRSVPDLSSPARSLMLDGDIEPLLDLIEEKLFQRFSARDKRWHNELAVKTAFMALLFLDVNYRLFSEPAIEGAAPLGLGHGFADLVLLLRPDARSTPFSDLLLEFKVVKPEALGADTARLDLPSRDSLAQLAPVAAALDDAAAQARRYRAGLLARYGDTLRLRAWAVVAIGFRRLVAREVV